MVVETPHTLRGRRHLVAVVNGDEEYEFQISCLVQVRVAYIHGRSMLFKTTYRHSLLCSHR